MHLDYFSDFIGENTAKQAGSFSELPKVPEQVRGI